jgi:hypothetical protein
MVSGSLESDGSARQPSPVPALVSLALGALTATAGCAKLYLKDAADRYDLALAAIGGMVVLSSACWALRRLRALPACIEDCQEYGRHMVGLTYLLLVVGLCNGVGTCILALEGGLGFSATQLVHASDPKHVEQADAKRELARKELRIKDRAISDARRVQIRAEHAVTHRCAGELATTSDCASARGKLLDAQDAVIARDYDWNEAYAAEESARVACEKTRMESRAALFFLLSVSTMMSLFGATFYVVNRVRSKRSLLSDEAGDEHEDRDARKAPAPGATPAEAFDAHAFWSGAFFRVGEAVLFTFAFFWLIWTSGDRAHVIWLPVLGLFVGMFVRTGEAVIFRLGERLLLATQTLLPAGDPAARDQPKPRRP